MTWLLSAGALLGGCAIVILIERGIDAFFNEGEDFEHE